MTEPTTRQLLDEYDRYLDASPRLSDSSRLVLAERIIRQIKKAEA